MSTNQIIPNYNNYIKDLANKVTYDNLDKMYPKVNCVSEVPQNIKLELKDGRLTLKAGSIVCVPDGVDNYRFIEIPNDISVTQPTGYATNADNIGVFYRVDGSLLWANQAIDTCSSGTTPSASQQGMYFNTASNTISYYSKGANDNKRYSFPLALVNCKDKKVVQINQVFNGVGFIGSRIFYLPGIKVSIPNGRNTDGSLNNLEVTLDKPILSENYAYTVKNQITGFVLLNGKLYHETSNTFVESVTAPSGTIKFLLWYDPIKNLVRRSDINGNFYTDNYLRCPAIMGIDLSPEFRVSRVRPLLPHRPLFSSDKNVISSWGLPSDKFVDLSVASGGVYIAPDDGYFSINGKDVENGTYAIVLRDIDTRYFGVTCNTVKTPAWAACILPVKKGTRVGLYVSGPVDNAHFVMRFYYLVGEEVQ